MAITSLVLGILSIICFGLLAGIPAIILGHIAFSRAKKSPLQFAGAGLALAGFIMGYASIMTTLVLAGLFLPALANAKGKAQSIMCVSNMKQIGLSFRVWAGDNNDRFPFNVSTTNGGTMELSSHGAVGLEQNPAIHFQVLSNELMTPKVLVCPLDTSKQPATSFNNLQSANVSYQIFSGPGVDESNPEGVLMICPLHGHKLLCDGHVDMGHKK